MIELPCKEWWLNQLPLWLVFMFRGRLRGLLVGIAFSAAILAWKSIVKVFFDLWYNPGRLNNRVETTDIGYVLIGFSVVCLLLCQRWIEVLIYGVGGFITAVWVVGLTILYTTITLRK